MIIKLRSFFSKRYLPRWMVLFFDLFIVLITFLISYILRFNFRIEQVEASLNPLQMVIVLPAFFISFILIKSFAGIMRHSTTEDIARIIFALSIGSAILAFFTAFIREINPGSKLIIPYSVIIIQFAIATNILLTSRFLAKALYNEWFRSKENIKNVMIYGAGKLGAVTRNALMMERASFVKIVGFIDDNIFLQNKHVAGIPVYSNKKAFEKVIPACNISEIIIAIDKAKLPGKVRKEIIHRCISRNIMVKEVPSVNNWINGVLKTSEIKQIKIEDLLGRDAISLDRRKIEDGVKDAVILIAGAAGSIGSEIVKQLMDFNAFQVILLDKAESDLYDLQNEILQKYQNPHFNVVVGDVTNYRNLKKIFEKYQPTIVINAAAYKHVPLMEEFPNEAIRVNIGGTRNLANLSILFGVAKFVFISTDKAVNPTNVMGTTKRISEMYIQSLAQKGNITTQFITTRFGNVLGSNGSVVPLFKKQIECGGPVTVTHREITRFFMTIPEACQLVLEACFMAKGGEIFVFDMGEPVKIYDLAEKMIVLSGLVPHLDIKIEVTNLRPGEKLYEELMMSQENLKPTYNDKIMIGTNMKHNYFTVNNQIEDLLNSVDEWDNQYLVDYMKRMVPEFISKNSYYNQLPLKMKVVKPAQALA